MFLTPLAGNIVSPLQRVYSSTPGPPITVKVDLMDNPFRSLSTRVMPLVLSLVAFVGIVPEAHPQVVSFDPNYTPTLFASGLQGPDNMVYRPATNDFLVAQIQRGQIARVDAVTGQVSVFASLPSPYQGYAMAAMAVNSKGEVYLPLYAVSGP